MKELKTKRLLLTLWKEEDARQLYQLARNPNVGPHAGWKPHDTVEESLEIIRTLFMPGNVWKITNKESGILLGTIALEPDKIRPGIASKEMGYWIGEEHWGKGYITEAAQRIIEFGFEEMNLDILSICTGPSNLRSQQVIRKLGFTYEGTHRHCYKIYDGTIRDTLTFSMTKEEWEAKESI